MSTPEPHLVRRVAQAALAVHRDELWHDFGPDTPVAVRLEGEDAIWYAALDGPRFEGDRTSATIVFVKGPVGLRHLRDVADDLADEDCERLVERFDVRYLPLHEIRPADRTILQRAGVLLDSGEAAPEFRWKGRNRSATFPDRKDLRRLELLLLSLRALGRSDDAAQVPDGMPTVTLAAHGAEPARVTSEVHADDLGRTVAPVRLSADSAEWPVVEDRWAIGVYEVPSRLESVRSFPMLFVVGADDGRRIAFIVCRRDDARSRAQRFARGHWIEDVAPAFPSELLVVGAELRDRIAEALEPRGVRVVAVESHPVLEETAESFREMVRTAGGPDDLGAWQEAADHLDSEARSRFYAAFEPRESHPAFFGSWRPRIDRVEDEESFEGAMTSLEEWGAFAWRRTPGAPTIAERMLSGDLDDRERTLLEAHAAAAPSLYVVREHDLDSGATDVADVFTGETARVYDDELGEFAEPGMAVPLRVFAAGPFHLARLAGPAFLEDEIPDALREIEAAGGTPTREGLAANPRVLGRLWRWAWALRGGREVGDPGDGQERGDGRDEAEGLHWDDASDAGESVEFDDDEVDDDDVDDDDVPGAPDADAPGPPGDAGRGRGR
jgi:hypothetical protein